MGWLSSLLGGGLVGSIENIASEWIETDMESAEAKALMVKTLDPNGKMRRDLSRAVTRMYQFYIIIAAFLLIAESFGYGDAVAIAGATVKWTELFLPITGLFGAIVTASFGVNAMNTKQGK